MFYSILQSPPYGIEIADVEGIKTAMVSIATDGERVVAVVSRLESFLLAGDEDMDTHEFSFLIAVFTKRGTTKTSRRWIAILRLHTSRTTFAMK